jgi:hypothetical protein
MSTAAFEPTIPISERPQTHALDRAATGIGYMANIKANTKPDTVRSCFHPPSILAVHLQSAYALFPSNITPTKT